jgi:uracil-DNA glycosylase
LLDENHDVVVTLGATATRETLAIPGKDYKADYYHGCVRILKQRARNQRYVSTYHPAYLLQGNHNLSQVLLHDVGLAWKLVQHGSTGLPGVDQRLGR